MKLEMEKTTMPSLTIITGLLLLTAALAGAAAPDGNWSWTTPGRNGGAARESVLSLKSHGEELTGKLSTPGRDGKPTDTPITEGHVDGSKISFNVVRVYNGNTNSASYSGTVADEKITGKISTVRNGETQTRDWVAKNAGDKTEATASTVVPPKPGYDEAGHKIVNETHFKEISVDESVKFLAQHPDAIILDLRPPEDYAKGHLENAKNFDVSDEATYKSVLVSLDKTKWYLVHSVVGHFRTVRALEYFEANGFEHAVAIDGGYQAWIAAGKPVTKS